MNKNKTNLRNLIVGAVIVATPLASRAAGEPVSGIASVDSAILILTAAVAAVGVMYGTGAALRGGSLVWNKVTKYFSKSL